MNASTTAIDFATQFLRRNRRAERQIITPEGVPLTVELADYGERTSAFLIDLTIWLIASIAVLLLLVLTPFHAALVATGQPSARSNSAASSGRCTKLTPAAPNLPSVSLRM